MENLYINGKKLAKLKVRNWIRNLSATVSIELTNNLLSCVVIASISLS